MLAETWEQNVDASVYTFHLSPRAIFQDGSPCDAAAVKASFTRFLGLGALPVNIIRRFVQDPAQMAVLDRHTIRFDLGRPDRKSTRLNSSHANISYAVFCLKKKKKTSS